MAFIQLYWPYMLGLVLFVLNEVLAANPNLKSNSIFQLIMGLLAGLGPKSIPPGGTKAS
jgi:uncharacterized membrane protein